jgi:hypothetical protein
MKFLFISISVKKKLFYYLKFLNNMKTYSLITPSNFIGTILSIYLKSKEVPSRTCDIVPCHRSWQMWMRVGSRSRIIEYINQTRLLMGRYVSLEKQWREADPFLRKIKDSEKLTRNEVWRKPKREREMAVMEKLKMFIVQEPVVAASCLIAGVGNFLSPKSLTCILFSLSFWISD